MANKKPNKITFSDKDPKKLGKFLLDAIGKYHFTYFDFSETVVDDNTIYSISIPNNPI